MRAWAMGFIVVGLLNLVLATGQAIAYGSGCPDASMTYIPSTGVADLNCYGECPDNDVCEAYTTTTQGVAVATCACWSGGTPYSPAGTKCVIQMITPPGGQPVANCLTAECSTTCPNPPHIQESYPDMITYDCLCNGS